MAEAVGVTASLVSLASLFSTCIECFGYYRAAKEFPKQIKMKLVKLDFEKTRLLIWANQVGLVSTDSRSRNPGIERNEARLRQTMEQIELLLAEANKVQDKYGVRQQEQTIAAIEASPDLVSRNSLATFTTSYRRFCGRFFESTKGPKVAARVRWAILDENKFEGLLKTLKDFVDNLFWLVEVERSVQDQIVEEDIMAVSSLLELELIKDASEHEYQVWSDIASRAADRTERGTIPVADTDDQDIREEDVERSRAELYYFRIRVDDRLNVTCCPPAAAHGRLVALLNVIRRSSRLTYGGDDIDEIWLEQRIQANGMDEHHLDRDGDPANSYKHLYVEESYNPLETIGAIVLLGEEDQIREVMSSESFPRHPHVPRAGEIYAMHRKGYQNFTRHYLGTYVPNPSLVKKSAPSPDLVQPPPGSGLALSQDQLANGEPPAKRRKVSVNGLAHHETSQASSQAEASESSAASISPLEHIPSP
ncbi:MAG: hypothetical protein Q9208_004178 [Pyrenodesmia sp. 3 TL-2023]